jgi:pyruvate,water dikinase
MFPYRTVPSVAVDKAAAVVTDEGGLLSHAAIICRENQVPALLGAEQASTTLADGMIVEVDATRSEGSITILAR